MSFERILINKDLRRILNICGIIFYKFLMDIIYTVWVSPYYEYMGMTARFDLRRFLFVNVIFILLVPFVAKHCEPKRKSDYILLIWDFMYLIPGITYITFRECSDKYVLYYLMFFFLIMLINELLPKPSISLKLDERIAMLIVIALFCCVSLMTLKYNGLNIKYDFSDIYEIRNEYSVTSKSYNIIFLYLKNPMANIIPIAVYALIKNRRWVMAMILIVLQLMLFSMGASKINFIFLLISIAAVFVTLDGKMIVTGFLGLECVSFILSIFLPNPMVGITDKLVRRMMITPNQLSLEYFNFFSENPILWFRSSILRFLGNPYGTSTGYVIGEYLGTNNNSNNGLAGDAFANCGMYAVIIYPLLYGLIFWIFNVVSQEKDKGIVILSALIIALIYIDASYFTGFMTHGVYLILFFLMICPYKEKCFSNEKCFEQEKNCI